MLSNELGPQLRLKGATKPKTNALLTTPKEIIKETHSQATRPNNDKRRRQGQPELRMGNTREAEPQQIPKAESQSINKNKFSTDMATKEKRQHCKRTISIVLIVIAALTTGCGKNDLERQESDIKSTKKQINNLQSCAGSNSQQATQRTVSIVPQFSASRIQSDYWPLLTELGKQTNICFQLKQQASIPLFEEELKTGSIDYAFMNPYHQVMVRKTYSPILRDEQKLLKGIIVAYKESNITSPKQLHGKTLLLPAPNAFAASLLTRSYRWGHRFGGGHS